MEEKVILADDQYRCILQAAKEEYGRSWSEHMARRLAHNLRDAMEREYLSEGEILADLPDLGIRDLRHALYGTAFVRDETIEQLAWAVNVHPAELLADNGETLRDNFNMDLSKAVVVRTNLHAQMTERGEYLNSIVEHTILQKAEADALMFPKRGKSGVTWRVLEVLCEYLQVQPEFLTRASQRAPEPEDVRMEGDGLDKEKFARNLRKLLRSRFMSASDCARRCGLSTEEVIAYMSGASMPETETDAERMAESLSVEFHALMGYQSAADEALAELTPDWKPEEIYTEQYWVRNFFSASMKREMEKLRRENILHSWNISNIPAHLGHVWCGTCDPDKPTVQKFCRQIGSKQEELLSNHDLFTESEMQRQRDAIREAVKNEENKSKLTAMLLLCQEAAATPGPTLEMANAARDAMYSDYFWWY